MAIINCPNCGNPISDQAVQCPKCGEQLKASATMFQGSTKSVDTKPLPWYMWVLLLLTGWAVDLIYYFVMKDKAPVKAKQSLTCLWINVGLWILLILLGDY